MIFYHGLGFLLESIIVTITLSCCFHLCSKIKIISCITSLTFISMFFHFTYHNKVLAIILSFCILLLYIRSNTTINSIHIITIIILLGFIVLSLSIALLTAPFIEKVSILTISTSIKSIKYIVIFSRIIYCFFCFIFYKTHKYEEIDISVKSWGVFFFLLFLFLLVVASILDVVIHEKMSDRFIVLLIVELIIIIILFFLNYIKLQKEVLLKKEMEQEILKQAYTKKMYDIITTLTTKVENDKHMLLYSLMKIDGLLAQEKQEEVKLYVKQEMNKLVNYRYISDTGNILFDYEITTLINNLYTKQIDIKPFFLLSKCNKLLEDTFVVKDIMDGITTTVHHYKDINKLDISIQEKSNYIVVKLLLPLYPVTITKDKYCFHRIKNIQVNNHSLYQEIIFLIQ